MPCLRRAADVEEYGERDEVEVEGSAEGGEGWVTASSRPQGPVSTTNDDGFEEIASISGAVQGVDCMWVASSWEGHHRAPPGAGRVFPGDPYPPPPPTSRW